MKISIGYNLTTGPWGGGNQFGVNLSNFLKDQGWDVIYALDASDIDIILLTEPRKELQSSAFNHIDIKKYQEVNSKVVVVHRINECDERKGTKDVNNVLMEANEVANHTIFISEWLKDIFEKFKDFDKSNSTVIRNGADEEIFNNKNHIPWDHKSPLKLVTHHWGGNWMKGFDIYEYIDNLIPKGFNFQDILFTYIGNVPSDFEFKNSKLISPLSGLELASEISKNHIYITGSQNEPGGMHHIEGCLCGLPPVYRISGALTEHCKDYGEGFNDTNDFENALNTLINKYDYYQNKIEEYPYNATLMCSQYEELFIKLLNK